MIKIGPKINAIALVFGTPGEIAGEWRKNHIVRSEPAKPFQSLFTRFFHVSTCLIKIRSYSSVHKMEIKMMSLNKQQKMPLNFNPNEVTNPDKKTFLKKKRQLMKLILKMDEAEDLVNKLACFRLGHYFRDARAQANEELERMYVWEQEQEQERTKEEEELDSFYDSKSDWIEGRR